MKVAIGGPIRPRRVPAREHRKLRDLTGHRPCPPKTYPPIRRAGSSIACPRDAVPSLSFSWAPVLIAAAVTLVWLAGAAANGPAPAAALERLQTAERIAWIATRLIGSCLVLPLVEELAFRGFLLPWLVAPDFEAISPRSWTWPAVLLSSLAFGAVHQDWILGAIAGVAFAAARAWRGRLGDAVLAHSLSNVGIAAAVLLGGRWELWG